MRNDVKLGFAIGGVLLAVLIVYVLVGPGSGGRNGADELAQSDVTLEPVAPDGGPVAQSPPPPAPPAQFNPGGGSRPQGSETTARGNAANAGGATADAAPQQPSPSLGARLREADWNKILNEQPVLIAETPVPTGTAPPPIPPITPAPDAHAPQGDDAQDSTTPAIPPVIASNEENDDADGADAQPAQEVAVDAPSAPPPQPAEGSNPPPIIDGVERTGTPTAGRTHVVQAGETFSSISLAAYGSPNFYPAIVRANPDVDPQRLRPGMTITLPELAAVRPSGSDAQSAGARIGPTPPAASAQPIDTNRQYRVEAGDSLHKIALKLYGQSTKADKIYEANKEAIGDDPHRLKVGQVLQLPEPPQASASR